MNAHADDRALGRSNSRNDVTRLLWGALFVLVFAAAGWLGFQVVRGRMSAAQPAVQSAAGAGAVPTVAGQSAAPAMAVPTVAAKISAPGSGGAPAATGAASSSGPAAASTDQTTPTADQAAAWYTWQQSHEQDFCSCNAAQPPSSP